ncbi:hypothetical protein CPLU01_08132 [Colletotrichum plurivorum]|uniref:Uncharacterized protein n=1 Tax=Colletotrichum plurivorum TaxID=2175906 RepID=A0A8H6KCL8_9PEZI|nr:hypothetical protein CPLU01_08132 [Colletotrichum plurivorum]
MGERVRLGEVDRGTGEEASDSRRRGPLVSPRLIAGVAWQSGIFACSGLVVLVLGRSVGSDELKADALLSACLSVADCVGRMRRHFAQKCPFPVAAFLSTANKLGATFGVLGAEIRPVPAHFPSILFWGGYGLREPSFGPLNGSQRRPRGAAPAFRGVECAAAVNDSPDDECSEQLFQLSHPVAQPVGESRPCRPYRAVEGVVKIKVKA